jgi:hypothetical protein
MAYGLYYMSSLVYFTPSATLLYKEFEDIQHPVVAAILPKMISVVSAVLKVVFGSSSYYDLGLDHLATVHNFSCLQ